MIDIKEAEKGMTQDSQLLADDIDDILTGKYDE